MAGDLRSGRVYPDAIPSDDAGLRERIAETLDRLGLEELTANYRDEHRAAEAALDEAFDPLPEALAEVPAVAEVNRVNDHADGGDVLVPVVTVLFEDAGEPDLDAVWGFVDRILRAVHPQFADHHVRHYDLQFAYADADEEAVIYRRITVHPPLVERFLGPDAFDLAALRAAVAEGDDGDDGVPPVDWQVFDAGHASGSGAYSGSSAAIATTAAASSAAACSGAAGATGGGSC